MSGGGGGAVAPHRLLLEAARAVVEQAGFERAAERILDRCRRATGATAGYVTLLDASGRASEIAHVDAGGAPCEVDPALALPVRGLSAEAYAAGRAVFDNEYAASPHAGLLPAGHPPLESVLLAPFFLEGRPRGLIGLANKPGGFTGEDAELAESFGQLAAVALENARLFGALREEKERTERILRTAGALIVVLDRAGRVTLANRAACRVLGRGENEVVGADWTEIFVPPQAQPFTREVLAGLVADEDEQRFDRVEGLVRTASGEDRVIRWSNALVRDARGAVVGVLASGEDVTERKAAEAALVESEQRFRLLFDRMTAAATIHELVFEDGRPVDYRFLEVNPAFERITGIFAERAVGRRMTEVLPDRKSVV